MGKVQDSYDRAAGTDVAYPKSCIPLRCWTACWLQPYESAAVPLLA